MRQPKDETILILGVGVIGLAYFGVIKPLTDALGLTKSGEQADSDKKTDTYTTGVAANPWLATFYKKYKVDGAKVGNYTKLKEICNRINKGYRNYWLNDYESIMGGLKQVRSKTELSRVSEVYYQIYKKDLYAEMKKYLNQSDGPFFWKFKNQIKEVNDYVTNLPLNYFG
jgi:hypothetical protein